MVDSQSLEHEQEMARLAIEALRKTEPQIRIDIEESAEPVDIFLEIDDPSIPTGLPPLLPSSAIDFQFNNFDINGGRGTAPCSKPKRVLEILNSP